MALSRREFIKIAGMASVFAGIDSPLALANKKTLKISFGPTLPSPIQEIYPAVFKNEIYVTGGFIPSDSPTFFGLAPSKNLHIYSPSKDMWRLGKPIPETRHHLGMASNSTYLYGVGGFSGPKEKAWQIQDSVFRTRSANNDWHFGPKLPSPVSEGIYANIGENIHVIGGVTIDRESGRFSHSQQHFILIDNEHWETAAPPSVKRSSAAGTRLDDRIYTFGGRQGGKQAKNLTFCEVYDKRADRWETIRPLPFAVAGLTAVPLDGKILVAGGEAFGPGGNWKTGAAHNYLWIYDPHSDTWQDNNVLPEPRHGHGAVSINDSVYLIGGAKKVGPQETTNTVLKIRRLAT